MVLYGDGCNVYVDGSVWRWFCMEMVLYVDGSVWRWFHMEMVLYEDGLA